MRALAVLTLYALVGLACALIWWLRQRDEARLWSLGLMVVAWPLLAPTSLLTTPPAVEVTPVDLDVDAAVADSPDAAALLEALQRAQGTPLAVLLPDRATSYTLALRLRDARHRLTRLDALLARRAFRLEDAQAQLDDAEARGERAVMSLARSRVRAIERARRMRARLLDDITVVRELLVQLRMHAELVPLMGEQGDARQDAGALLDAIVARVEGLDDVLDEEDALAMFTASIA